MSLLESCGERYGDVFTIRTFGLGDVVFVADPLAVKEVFTGGGRAATPACPHATRAAQPAR
jgi:cytochrome P450